MKNKQTLFLRITLMVLLFLSWSCVAFALQDTTRNSHRRNVDSEAGQGDDRAGEQVYDDGQDEYQADEQETAARARAMPGASDEEQDSERNKDYYAEDVKKHDFDPKKWQEVTKGINYLDDVPEKKEEEKKEPGKGWNLSFPGAAALLKIVMFSLVIIALALVLYKLFGGSFVRNRKIGENKVFTLEDIEERLHESDLDRMLREALSKGDFRLAVRIYYLAIIKELSVKEWIRWKKDKTNREYLNEVIASKPDLYKGFRDATIAFERVWYGDLEIREKEYNMLSPGFRSFIDTINRA